MIAFLAIFLVIAFLAGYVRPLMDRETWPRREPRRRLVLPRCRSPRLGRKP